MTPAAIEIVRFTVPPEREAELVAGHGPATRAIAAVAPGSRWARLVQLDERTWLEIVAWGSVAEFEHALELAPADPTAAAWFGLADGGWSIVTGAFATHPADGPPAGGALRLDWWPGDAAARDGGAHAGWCARARIDARAWVEPSGWAERDATLLVLSADAPAAAPVSELARVADAVDLPVAAG